MSWQDRIKNVKFTITTHGRSGRKTWSPLLVPEYSKAIEYNGTQYEFINRIGSLFARKFPKGKVYQLTFVFQGSNHDKESNSFEIECRDANPLVFTHPIYGSFTAQPMSMELNTSGLSSTTIKMSVVETLVVKSNRIIDLSTAESVIHKNVTKMRTAQTAKLSQKVPVSVAAKDIQFAQSEISKLNKISATVAKIDSEYKLIKKYADTAVNSVNVMSYFSDTVMTNISNVIRFPVQVSSDVGTRVKAVNSMLDSLTTSIKGAATLNYFQRIWFNLCGCSCVSAVCETLSTPNTGDYNTRKDVLKQIDDLQNVYDSYVNLLYTLENDTFSPDHDTMFALNELVCETAFYLYLQIFNTKQERTHYPSKDTNLILLAHRLYGAATDENINALKVTNKIGLSEIINIKKDRPILYYI